MSRSLVLQAPYRDHVHAVFAAVRYLPDAHENHQERRILHLGRVNLVPELDERLCSVIDEALSANLDLNEAVAAVTQMDDGITFQSFRIAIVIDFSQQAGRIGPEVSHGQSLKVKAESVEIRQQVSGANAQGGSPDGRIRVVSGIGGTDGGLGPEIVGKFFRKLSEIKTDK